MMLLKNSVYLFVDLSKEEVSVFEKFVPKLDGVIKCRVSPVSCLVLIIYNPLVTFKETLVNSIRKRYSAVRKISKGSKKLKEKAVNKNCF